MMVEVSCEISSCISKPWSRIFLPRSVSSMELDIISFSLMIFFRVSRFWICLESIWVASVSESWLRICSSGVSESEAFFPMAVGIKIGLSVFFFDICPSVFFEPADGDGDFWWF